MYIKHLTLQISLFIILRYSKSLAVAFLSFRIRNTYRYIVFEYKEYIKKERQLDVSHTHMMLSSFCMTHLQKLCPPKGTWCCPHTVNNVELVYHAVHEHFTVKLVASEKKLRFYSFFYCTLFFETKKPANIHNIIRVLISFTNPAKNRLKIRLKSICYFLHVEYKLEYD